MSIKLKKIHSGKVRDTYIIPDNPDLLLLVASDRISTHNVVHKNTIPCKGYVLTALTVFWLTTILKKISGTTEHLIDFGSGIFNHFSEETCSDPEDIARRAIVVRRLNMIPVEFIFRSYLTGSLYKKYYSKGIENPYGISLPEGMVNMSKFESTIFTPTDKSETDDPINSFSTRENNSVAYGKAIRAYNAVREHLNSVGIELIDSKLELGLGIDSVSQRNIMIGDEVFTPDSSRFCELKDIREGQDPAWLDKQIARDVVEEKCFDKKYCSIEFSETVVNHLTNTYLSIFERITAESLDDFTSGY